MLAIGLTGGIGAGKSAVSSLLAGYGAAVVDADLIAREVVVPGGPAYGPLVERFGPSVLADDGTVDRGALASVAFADPLALADLDAITHPVIGRVMAGRMAALAGNADAGGDADADPVAVAVIPLLGRRHVEALGLRAVVVVDCPEEVAVARLVHERGMEEADVRRRMAAQLSRGERVAMADYVLDNSSTLEDLRVRVGKLWAWLEVLRQG
jgi:dephospho-CoA kinase